MRESIRKDFHDAIDRIVERGGVPSLIMVAEEARHSRRLISSPRTQYPDVRDRILAARPPAPEAVAGSREAKRNPGSAAVIRALRTENAALRREAAAAASMAAAVLARAATSTVAHRQMADLAERRRAREQRKAADLGLDASAG